MPTVSIGMPVFNGEKYLEHAIESILVQTSTDFELIILITVQQTIPLKFASIILKKIKGSLITETR